MEINFCDTCDNLMFLYSNEENDSLYLGCKVCGQKKDFIENKCIYSSEFKMDLSETMNQNEYLANDNRYNSPNYRESEYGWVVYNEDTGKILKSIKYTPADFAPLL